jgi:hypothetical protein
MLLQYSIADATALKIGHFNPLEASGLVGTVDTESL